MHERRLFIIAMPALVLLASCQGFHKQPGLLEAVGVLPPPPTLLTVMSFNVRYGTADDGVNRWRDRRSLLLDVIASQDPDILSLQESLRFQIDEIRTVLPQFDEVGVGRDDGKTAGEYSAILYRADRFRMDQSGTFWLSDTPEVVGSKSWGNGITRICTWARLIEKPGGTAGPGGRAFYVFNTHLDHQSEPSRQKSVELIAARIQGRLHPNDQVILTGDFNCGEKSQAIRFLTGQANSPVEGSEPVKGWSPLIDTYRAIHADEEQVGTFHDFKGGADGEKIDYIFVQQGIEVRSSQIIRSSRDGRYPSDHFPVVAVLRLSK